MDALQMHMQYFLTLMPVKYSSTLPLLCNIEKKNSQSILFPYLSNF